MGRERRHQDSAERPGARRRCARSIPARGARQQPPHVAQHGDGVRLRPGRQRRLLPRDGAARGRVARPALQAREAACARRRRWTPPGRRSVRSPRRTPRGSSIAISSRTTCSSRAATTDENGATSTRVVKVVDFGIAKMLRDDELADERGRDAGGHGLRHAAIHVPRAGPGQAARRAQRPLLARRDSLPHAHGAPAVHGRRRDRRHGAAHQDAAEARRVEAAPQANIPPELENVVMRVLSKEPHQRPASAEAMSQELARAMNLSSTTSGVRGSGDWARLDAPPSRGAESFRQLPAPPAVPVLPIPPAPMSDGYLSSLPSSTESLQIAAGVRASKKKRTLGAVGAVIAIAVLAAIAFGDAHSSGPFPGRHPRYRA